MIFREEDQEGYFCSQVVARGLQEMGVLSSEGSSAQFWPSDFGSKKKLPMINGAFFGPELILDFKTWNPRDEGAWGANGTEQSAYS